MSFMLSRTSLELPVLFIYQVTWYLLVIMTAMVDHVQLEKYSEICSGVKFSTLFFIFLEKTPLVLLYMLYLLHFVFGVNVPLFLIFRKKKHLESFRFLRSSTSSAL